MMPLQIPFGQIISAVRIRMHQKVNYGQKIIKDGTK
jgi:hypothetical protein